jgi:hypothetical protein
LAGGAALGADAGDDQAMARHAELMLSSYGLAQPQQLIAGEFEQLVALGALEMIVLRIAVIVFVHGPAAENHFPQQAGFDHFGQRAVNRRPAHFAGSRGAAQVQEQLIGVEMLVPPGNLFDEDAALLGNSLAARLQKFLEPFERRKSNLDGSK